MTYSILKGNRAKNRNADYVTSKELHKEQVQRLIKDYRSDDFYSLFQICNEYIRYFGNNNWKLSSGIQFVFENCFNNERIIPIVKEYLKSDTPYNVLTAEIIQSLFALLPAERVRELIDTGEYTQKNYWLWNFYVELPPENFSEKWLNELLDFLELDPIPSNSDERYYRPIESLEKYEVIDKDIIQKATKIILAHYKDSPDRLRLYFDFVDTDGRESPAIFRKFQSNILLLEEIYLSIITGSTNMDSEGHFLSEIVARNPKFLQRYLDVIIAGELRNVYLHDFEICRLQFIWCTADYCKYLDEIIAYVFEKSGHRYYLCCEIVKILLRYKYEDITTSKKQDAWIKQYIERSYLDKDQMCLIFGAICEHSAERRIMALKTLLHLNQSMELFEQLPLEPSCIGGTGSLIPRMQERIEYLSSLLPILSGIKFLKHRQRVESLIEKWRYSIQKEEIEELLLSMS